MKEKVIYLATKLHPKHVAKIIDTFIKDESIGGKVILAAAILSLVVVNSPLREAFNNFWHTKLTLGVNSWNISLDLKHWVNEGLMALFFLVVGLEIKRELTKGELSNFKTAVLPIGAAIGGMIIPALIYLFFNFNTDSVQGWGIPIATDIALAVAVLSLLKDRVPFSLKIFLLTLAISDDIGAIFVIALFYAEIINYWYLAISFIIAIGIYIFRKLLTYRLFFVSLLGIILWVTTYLSGIHASIVGAAMGFLAPVARSNKIGVAEKVEKSFLPFTTFFILPIFAFANAGFTINGNSLSVKPLLGIFLGLVLGKVIGITLASWLLVKLKIAKLPDDISWRHIIGTGFVAGIGFTVSIFITELAFSDNQAFVSTAKISIFIASFVSGVLGLLTLKYWAKTKL